MYAGQGLVNGLIRSLGSVKDSAASLGEAALSSMTGVISRISDAVSSDMDMNPTIRPVIDLTDITKGGQAIDKMLSAKTVNLTGSSGVLSNISAGVGSMKNSTEVVSNIKPEGKASTISYVQNNYSPTALSRIEIYRQTRNQLKGYAGV